MNDTREPRHLIVRAQGDRSPLYTAEDQSREIPDKFTSNLPLGDPALGLPEDLADQLASWSLARPPGGFTSRQQLRSHVKRGMEVTQRLAKHLGPPWVVRFWDESHDTAKFVCWGCRRLHWAVDAHGTLPHPLHITVEGEYKWYPLRAEGFGDFAPDDPAAGLDLSDDLVADLYKWAQDINTSMNLYLRDRDEDRDDARRRELDLRGRELAERVAREAGPGRTVTYGGLA